MTYILFNSAHASIYKLYAMAKFYQKLTLVKVILLYVEVGLKRLFIFAYRLTVNTNDRFIGLTIIDYCD